MTLLETAAHSGGPTALTIGLITFGALLLMLVVAVAFGSGRPHTGSK